MEKHAFMIMAHNDPEMLKLLVKSLDDKRNDIYVHIDASSKLFDIYGIQSWVNNAYIEVFSEVVCLWGDFSLVKCELFLLKKATRTPHQYYHLLSGTDYPIKSMDYIYSFFNCHAGKEFVFFTSKSMDKKHENWFNKFHFLQSYCRKSSLSGINLFVKSLEKVLIIMQELIGINRKKHYQTIYKGSQWFSITENFAKYVLSEEYWINKDFRFTFSSDEMLMPTLIMNSNYKEKLYVQRFDNSMEQNLRYIIFSNGIPKILSMDDYGGIRTSECILGRKFNSENIDIINAIKTKSM